MSIKEWDKLMDSIDKELETIHEALLEKEEKQSEKEQKNGSGSFLKIEMQMKK